MPAPSIVPSDAPVPGKGVVPTPAGISKVIVGTGTAGPVAAGGSFWDWVAAHPWETAAIGCGIGVAVGGSVYALNRWHQQRQEAADRQHALVPELRPPDQRRRSHGNGRTAVRDARRDLLRSGFARSCKSRPAFRELYEKEESFFAALREKLKGIKQKLSSAIVITASAAVSGYDFFAPIVSGVDVSRLTSRVPSWAWPLVLISVTALFQFLRNLADKRQSGEASTVGQET